ncbi:MAG: glutamate synthase large subunit [Dehalococcoidia bacterium]|uniref:glutamate synthase large subunit n=1 Tax=Candidatus Amarobacter glycogenicus TaxID=3140699 RepID=UPI003134E7E3|nr:glutamate synthase large subunit [Dehalococcoidia bacterium]
MGHPHLPSAQGLYRPEHEHDSCGVGFIVHLKGHRSHQIVDDGLSALEHLNHRGASGSEPNTGDGAGILIQTPHEFFRRECAKLGIRLPEAGQYGAGLFFASPDARARAQGMALFAAIVEEEGQHLLGWREVPTNNASLGQTALEAEPFIQQVFVGRGSDVTTEDEFERCLYVIRKRFEKAIDRWGIKEADWFYFASLSCRTFVYKGMLTAIQLREYFPDLSDKHVISAMAMFHSRFSTNTFPSWELAHPYRMVAHNGEINTLRGNRNWMAAREALFASPHFEDIHKILPIINEHGSDTASLDQALELLVLAGRPLAHAMMMLIPEAWQGHESMSAEKKAFYEYHSCLMEPWDGPASVAFTDGKDIGATLDRNGLRPSRYYVTDDDIVIMASEVGVLPIAPEKIVHKGRLQPGKMFLVSMEEGRIIDDAELKGRLATERPYADWLKRNLVSIDEIPEAEALPAPDTETLLREQIAFGYSIEDLKYILGPMAKNSEEALGSMGTDTPLAVLSTRPQPLYNYFQQLFAQVTNPPLDAIREELVTSVKTVIGPEGNLLDPEPESCHLVSLESPFIGNEELAKFKSLKDHALRATVLPMTFPVMAGPAGLEPAMQSLFEAADVAIEGGAKVLILSDRGVDSEHAPIPSLLAVAGLHNHLIREKKRTQVGLIVETGDAREVHHFALLIGYGAGAINPYLALDSLAQVQKDGYIDEGISVEDLQHHYLKAIKKGVVKVMSKMGISTIHSYRGAQIFEAIGLSDVFIDRYFTKTVSRIGGIGIDEVAIEALAHHQRAYPPRDGSLHELQWGGHYQWRRDGEFHLFNPDTVFKLQHATRTGQYNIFREYTKLVDDQAERMCTLRGLFEFRPDRPPVPIEQVESVESLFKRFATGAMSFGSISAEAHETLAIAMNRIGGRSNTGEGGEDRRRFTRDANGDLRRSSIKQVASGRFGVTSEYLVNADELQIKMAQGAKPGEGGQLPGAKVYPWIAEVRHAMPGVGLISPPPHHDIYSIEDLAQLIHDLKNSNPRARISVKLVAEVGVGTVAAGVAKAKSDLVLISGHDGGTGASPLTSLKHAGIPWELGLSETQQTLVLNKLRDRIVVQVDGQMKTGRDVIVGALLGAEEFGFATAPLVVMGCVMMRVCHLDTCPVGIATQNPELREKFSGKADHVVNFFTFIAEEVRGYMAQLGFRSLDEMIGRSDLLDVRRAVNHWKAQGLDLSAILYRPENAASVPVRRVAEQDHGLSRALDNQLLELCKPALERGEKVSFEMDIRNENRTVGTMLGSELTRKYGAAGLPDDTIDILFRGSAGQSFGAFVPSGITLRLEGDSNDYVGKGLSGGKVIVYPPPTSPFVPEENIVVGNVALYGATGGAAFFRGVAGERFMVRNSGAVGVVEGTGDHGCEYMTGGRAVVIGKTGRNFGAGMSGGIAFVFDEDGSFPERCNMEMVGLERLEEHEDLDLVQGLLERHLEYTGSTVAQRILRDWPVLATRFVKVMPREYRRVLDAARTRASDEDRETAGVGRG